MQNTHRAEETPSIATGSTVDADEVAFFARLADTWWDAHGPFKPLHRMNPIRLRFIREAIVDYFGLDRTSPQPLAGLRILDIGCGGGLLCEPLRRLGAEMVGVDASLKNINAASLHAEQMDLSIDYRNTTAEALAHKGETFDIVISFEVIEHVSDIDIFLASCRLLLKPGGLFLASTISRTVKSLLFAKIGAEYILRWLPVGAHDWNKFILPGELDEKMTSAGFAPFDQKGMVFNPLSGWAFSQTDMDVNYAVAAKAV